MGATGRQIGGDHYKQMAIQPIDFIAANDLEKAKHYIEIMIEKLEGKNLDNEKVT